MSTINSSDMDAAKRFAIALSNYPSEVSFGVCSVIPNLPNGCSWTFIKEGDVSHEKLIKSINNNKKMESIKIRGAYLYCIDMDHLLNILSKVGQGYITDGVLKMASEHRQKALASLEKFMRSGKVGKIGIYNLNDTNNVVVNGIRYPAFCVTIQDLLALCVRNGYCLKLGQVKRTPKQVYERLADVVGRLEVAPSNNALFIEITK